MQIMIREKCTECNGTGRDWLTRTACPACNGARYSAPGWIDVEKLQEMLANAEIDRARPLATIIEEQAFARQFTDRL